MSQATQDSVHENGVIANVNGPVVTTHDLGTRMSDIVYVGDEGPTGKVIEIRDDLTTIQVYEETSDVDPGKPVGSTDEPLTVDLGPKMVDVIHDGIQRSLDVLKSKIDSASLDHGVDTPGIGPDEKWEFEPTVSEGDEVAPGDVVRTVPETVTTEHKVMVPPGFEDGEVVVVEEGELSVTKAVVELDGSEEIMVHQERPMRQARLAAEKKTPHEPLVPGRRVLDGLFPIMKGGTAAIPGSFGFRKTVTQHQLAK